jgi:hypothetical protein
VLLQNLGLERRGGYGSWLQNPRDKEKQMEDTMARYGKKAQETVEEAMHKFKKGELKSGKSLKKVTNPKQAVAIGLSEAREKGAKVPKPAHN